MMTLHYGRKGLISLGADQLYEGSLDRCYALFVIWKGYLHKYWYFLIYVESSNPNMQTSITNIDNGQHDV